MYRIQTDRVKVDVMEIFCRGKNTIRRACIGKKRTIVQGVDLRSEHVVTERLAAMKGRMQPDGRR